MESKSSGSGPKTLLIVLSVIGLLLLAVAWEYFSATRMKSQAEADLATEQEQARKMETMLKEQAELERKIKAIDARINAIKELRANQSGPGAVLRALKERIDMAPGLYLESVEQKGSTIVVKGNSPNENTVTQFGRSLEFSSGLFSNLNIETQRKEMVFTNPEGGTQSGPTSDSKLPKPETVSFTIKCDYTPSKAAPPPALSTGANQSSTAQPAPSQVAKK